MYMIDLGYFERSFYESETSLKAQAFVSLFKNLIIKIQAI